jgi:exodeoxyribonuclease-3
VADWLQRQQPDVLALQETKVTDDLFPAQVLADAGYSSVFVGGKTYNGVALVSKEPATDVRIEYPLADIPEPRLISAVFRGIRVYCAYFPNGRDPESEHFQTKLAWIDGLGSLIFAEAQEGGGSPTPIALMGDFNVAPEPRDVYDPEAMEGRILYTKEERSALERLRQRGLVDAFRLKREEAGIYSWWDYRQGMFRRNIGLRIDHVWTTQDIASLVVDAYVDKDERRKPSPSDHAPVVVELDRPA